LNLTEADDIDFVYLKFNGFQSLGELRERAEWVRLRHALPYMLAPTLDEKSNKKLREQLAAPFYWEKETKPRRTKEQHEKFINDVKALFNDTSKEGTTGPAKKTS
jgi:hypothetical protein